MKSNKPRQMLATLENGQQRLLREDQGIDVRNYPYFEQQKPGYFSNLARYFVDEQDVRLGVVNLDNV